MIKNDTTYQYLQLFTILLLPWGLFFFEALPSILVILFAFPLILYGSKVQWRNMIRYCWPLMVIFVIILVSGFWSRDSDRWLSLLRVNLPYVVLPAAFYIWPAFLLSRRRLFQRSFILAGAALSVYLMVLLSFNSDEILSGIREGGSFEMPVHHVRTSLFLAIAGIFGWDEWVGCRWLSRRFIVWGILLLLVITGIHLLAVRTGLVLFYIGTVATFTFNKKFHTRRGMIGMGIFAVLVVLALLLIPTIREKLAYFLEDFRNYESHSWWFYSDAVRWKSNLMGWEIFKEAPWWGIGMGDLIDEMQMQFYNMENIRISEYPHNLWITFLAGSGIVGFCGLNIALTRLFILFRRYSTLVYRIIFFVFLISCLVETTLLTSLGAISFVMIVLLATVAKDDRHIRG